MTGDFSDIAAPGREEKVFYELPPKGIDADILSDLDDRISILRSFLIDESHASSTQSVGIDRDRVLDIVSKHIENASLTPTIVQNVLSLLEKEKSQMLHSSQECLTGQVAAPGEAVSSSAPVLSAMSELDVAWVQSLPPELRAMADVHVSRRKASFGDILQSIYFMTQRGPTRRERFGEGGRRVGDVAQIIPELEKAKSSFMVMDLYESLVRFYGTLLKVHQDIYRNEFLTTCNALKQAIPIFLRIEYLLNGNQSVDVGTIQQVLEQIDSLPREGFLILPGGYCAVTGGHFVVYEIQKQQNEKYSCTIFNSGEGLDFHEPAGTKYLDICIKNIDRRQLSAPFLTKLFNINIEKRHFIEELYSHLSTLGGFEAKGEPHYDQGGIGSCTHTSILFFIKEHLGSFLSEQFQAYVLHDAQERLERAAHPKNDRMSLYSRERIPEEITLPRGQVQKLLAFARGTLQRKNRWIQRANQVLRANQEFAFCGLDENVLSIIHEIRDDTQLTELEKQHDVRKILQNLAKTNELDTMLAFVSAHPEETWLTPLAFEVAAKVLFEEGEYEAAEEIARNIPDQNVQRYMVRLISASESRLRYSPAVKVEVDYRKAKDLVDPLQKSEALVKIVLCFLALNNISLALEALQMIPILEKKNEALIAIASDICCPEAFQEGMKQVPFLEDFLSREIVYDTIARNVLQQGRIEAYVQVVHAMFSDHLASIVRLGTDATTMCEQGKLNEAIQIIGSIPDAHMQRLYFSQSVKMLCDQDRIDEAVYMVHERQANVPLITWSIPFLVRALCKHGRIREANQYASMILDASTRETLLEEIAATSLPGN